MKLPIRLCCSVKYLKNKCENTFSEIFGRPNFHKPTPSQECPKFHYPLPSPFAGRPL